MYRFIVVSLIFCVAFPIAFAVTFSLVQYHHPDAKTEAEKIAKAKGDYEVLSLIGHSRPPRSLAITMVNPAKEQDNRITFIVAPSHPLYRHWASLDMHSKLRFNYTDPPFDPQRVNSIPSYLRPVPRIAE